MPDLQVRVLVDGRWEARAVPAGTTAGELVSTGRDIVAARVGGVLRDLSAIVADRDEVQAVPAGSANGLSILRHSTAHVLAQAVQALFPKARLGIGPPVADGFYYDFDVPDPFHPEDLERIGAQMRAIVKERQRFVRREVNAEFARAELATEPYKLELIDLNGPGAGEVADGAEVEVDGGALSIYDNVRRDGSVAWRDLCRGPHVPDTGYLSAFRLMRVAAAYWRGDEARPQLQRIYGTAWDTRPALAEHLHRLEEAARRDHRRLGVELDLFSFPDLIGSGLAVFHPKGGVLRKVMEDYSRQRHVEAGYQFVNSPHISKAALFETSGHLQWFREEMFPPMSVDFERAPSGDVRRPGQEYYLKPMNCPFHNLIFAARGRSYRELPLRLFEFGTVYRYERSGVIHGLTRVRGLTMDDAHIYCSREQMGEELKRLLTFVLGLLRDYGLDDFYLELSTRDDSAKFVGADDDWEVATAALRQAAEESGLDLVPDPGGAAFYGPKISVQARDAIGRTWQMSTVQLDFQMPQRFDLGFTAPDGSRQPPVMIHRALFGSIERFVGVLTEHYAGAFPPWLAPVQVAAVPIAERHAPYLEKVAGQLRGHGVRVEVDDSDDRMQKKIRTAQTQKVPYMLIAGDRDVEADAVSFRYRSGEQNNGVPVADAVAEIVDAVRRRVQV